MSEFLNMTLIEQGYDNLSISDKNTIISIVSNELGVEYTKVASKDILDYHKRIKVEYLAALCDQAIENGFTAYNGHLYRTNRDDQLNMLAQKTELADDQSSIDILWKTVDAGYISHTRDEWLDMYKEAFEHKKKQLFKFNELKQAVLQAKIHDDIVAVVW